MGTFIIHFFFFFLWSHYGPGRLVNWPQLTSPLSGNMAIETAGLTPKPFIVTTVLNATSEKGPVGEAQLEDLGIWKLTLLCETCILRGAFI